MPHKKNDNRMGWIRDLEKITKKTKTEYMDYELLTEARITGVFDYEGSKMLCAFSSMEKNEQGLYLYTLKIKYIPGAQSYNKNADEKGYYLQEGSLGEVLSLFALFFRCRFYLAASYYGNMTDNKVRLKTEYRFPHLKTNPHIHKPIFEGVNRNFSLGLKEFFETVKSLDEQYHQRFALACYLYSQALKEIGVSEEMVFIRLVSAIEILSEFVTLDTTSDPLGSKEAEIREFARQKLSNEEKAELLNLFNTRKSKKKFIAFVMNYSKGYLRGGNTKAPHVKIRKKNLPKVLGTIYDARSSYLHSGEPMYLSTPMHFADKWDMDPSVGMTIDNRNFPGAKKLPYAYFFEGLVRHCLLSFLKEKSNNP